MIRGGERVALLLALIGVGCGTSGPRSRGFERCAPPTGGFDLTRALERYPLLSDSCLVDTVGGALVHNPSSLPYDLTTPLFSDYAVKTRTAWLPPGGRATYSTDGAIDFPVGTILTKTFAFPADRRAPDKDVRLVETRLLVRNADGWLALPYVWNEAQTEATLEVTGAVRSISWTDDGGAPRSASYLVPTANQCPQCHESERVTLPLGLKASLLNRDFAYPDGSVENQLAHWTRTARLDGAPSPTAAPRLPAWDDSAGATVAERARAYLDVNCAHCHSPSGLARTTALDLTASNATPLRYGVCKPPIAAGPATGGLKYDVVPGQPDQSILVYRLESTTPGIMMPELGRSVVHTEGLALVRRWIAEMPPTPCD